MKKILSLLLVLTMVLALFSACGTESSSTESAVSAASEETTAPETSTEPEAAAPETPDSAAEPTSAEESGTVAETVGDPFAAMAEEYISYPLEGDNTISMWYYIPPYQDFMDSNNSFNALAAAEEATGVKLEFTEVSAQSASELFNVMVAGGDYPDLLPVMEYYSGGLSKAYEDGIILDINDYMEDNMPNYLAVRDCLDESTVKATLTDGMTLAFYQIKDGTYSGNGFVSRGDWIAEQGITFSGDVISLDEFTEYLRTIYSAYNCSNTIYMYDGTVGLEAAFDTEIPVLNGDGFMTMVTSAIFRKGDEVMSGWTTDGYREYLEWVLQMFDEGIMARDFLSLDTDRMVTNTMQASGAIGVWQSNADKIEEIVDTYGADYPELTVQALPRVAQDPSAQYVWNDEVALVSSMAGFSLSANCDNPELVCQWENYFWTTDGYYLGNYGTEGESYHMDGDTPVFDWDQPVTVTGKNAPNAEMAQQLFTMLRFASFYVDNDMLLPTFPQTGLDAVELWTIDGSTDDRYYPSAVKNTLTSDETLEIADYESDFLTYAAEQCLKFLDGSLELNDENWDTYVATCESMGLPEIIAVYQNAYDEYYTGER